MAVFTLDSDDLFVRKNHHAPGITVHKHKESTSIFEMVQATYPRWTDPVAKISAGGEHPFSALEVFGVRFSGESLATLTSDLTLTGEKGQKFYLWVNRRGVCYVLQYQKEPMKWLRIDGHFCWSKYGVVVKPESYDAVLGRSLSVKKEEEEKNDGGKALVLKKLV